MFLGIDGDGVFCREIWQGAIDPNTGSTFVVSIDVCFVDLKNYLRGFGRFVGGVDGFAKTPGTSVSGMGDEDISGEGIYRKC